MIFRVCAVSLLLLGFMPAIGMADAQSDALTLLGRVYAASQRLSYTGTIVYQHGNQSETSRITRIVEGRMIREKLEALDGQPREVVRNGDDVVCYLPAQATVRIDKYTGQKSFPSFLPSNLKEVAESYTFRRGEMERVAGFDCHILYLEPKDNMRYAHKLWVDAQTGMLLKAKTLGDKNELMEQFAFTQIQIGGNIDRERVKSSFAGKTSTWKVEDSGGSVANLAQAGWVLKAKPPGFRKILEMKRSIGGTSGIGHIVLSDGLAAISIFIELSGASRPVTAEISRQGAINVYARQIGEHKITVVGEAPVESVRYIANSVEYRKPN